MKKLIIGIVAIVVLIVGYLIYQEYFAYDPVYDSGVSESPPKQPPSSTEDYSKWVGHWVSPRHPEREPSFRFELDSSGLPRPTMFAPGGDTTDVTMVLIKRNDDSSLVYELKSEKSENSSGLTLTFDQERDRIEMQFTDPKTGKMIDSMGKFDLVRKFAMPGEYSDWAGDWVNEKDPGSNPIYRFEINALDLPKLTVRLFYVDIDTVFIKRDDESRLVYQLKSRPGDTLALQINQEQDRIEVYEIDPNAGIDQDSKAVFVRFEEIEESGRYPEFGVARAKAGMKAMTIGLISFHIDHNYFPEWVSGDHPLSFNQAPQTNDMPSFKLGTGNGAEMKPFTLTTPISYLRQYFPDPFVRNPEHPKTTYSYYSDTGGFILISPGPDGDYDIDPQRDYTSTISQPSTELLLKSYDSTNGAVSDGDVFRVHSRRENK